MRIDGKKVRREEKRKGAFDVICYKIIDIHVANSKF